jgi:hypothetical protein
MAGCLRFAFLTSPLVHGVATIRCVGWSCCWFSELIGWSTEPWGYLWYRATRHASTVYGISGNARIERRIELLKQHVTEANYG